MKIVVIPLLWNNKIIINTVTHQFLQTVLNNFWFIFNGFRDPENLHSASEDKN